MPTLTNCVAYYLFDSRRNMLANSNDFTNTTFWQTPSGLTLTGNYEDGPLTGRATRVTAASVASGGVSFVGVFTARRVRDHRQSGPMTLSLYVKPNSTLTNLAIGFSPNTTPAPRSKMFTTPTGQWTRVSWTWPTDDAIVSSLTAGSGDNAVMMPQMWCIGTSQGGNGGAVDFSIYGFQIEEGSTATTYEPIDVTADQVITDGSGAGNNATMGANTNWKQNGDTTDPSGVGSLGLLLDGQNNAEKLTGVPALGATYTQVWQDDENVYAVTSTGLSYVNGVRFDGIAAISLTAGTYNGIVRKYLQYTSVLTPTQIADIATEWGATTPRTKLLVHVGSSTVQGYRALPRSSFPKICHDILDDSTLLTVNKGVGGRTISDMISNWTSDGIAAMLANSGITRKAVVIVPSLNGIVAGTSAATEQTNTQTLCGLARAAGARVIVSSMQDRNDLTYAQRQSRDTFNAWIEANWSSFADAFVNLHDDSVVGFRGASADTQVSFGDSIHFSRRGYAHMGALYAGAARGQLHHSDPGIANVLSGTAYLANNSSQTGTLTLPATTDVRSGTSYGIGGNGSTGTLTLPGTANVLSGVTYGIGGNGSTGTLVSPIASNVRSGVVYGVGGNGSTGTYDPVTGQYTNPGASNVRSGTSYTFSGNTFTGTCAVPAAGSVALGVAVDNTTGAAVLTPAAVRTELSTELARIDVATSTRATPAQILTNTANTLLTNTAGYVTATNGGATTSVTVTPLSATVSAGEVTGDYFVAYQNQTATITIVVTDENGTAVNLNGKTVRFTASAPNTPNTAIIDHDNSSVGGLTISGGSYNNVQVTLSGTDTATPRDLVWAVWNVTDDKPVASGRCAIITISQKV